jgi:hypothetical protein
LKNRKILVDPEQWFRQVPKDIKKREKSRKEIKKEIPWGRRRGWKLHTSTRV